ncbi:MmcB family DNA repair protein [Pseudomonas segetis]
MTDQKKWGHDELAHDLAQSLRVNPEHIVWEDMQMGPSGSIRPDVYLLKKRYSTFAPVTYEVKISLSDFRSDVTSGKWQGYLNFSSAVIFAVPAGLVKKEDIPAGCGLIVRHEEVWRMVKKPTMQHLETLPRESWLKLVIDGIDRAIAQRDLVTQKVSPSSWSIQKLLSKKFGKEVSEMISKVMIEKDSLKRDLEMLEQQRVEIREESHRELNWARERIESEKARLTSELHDLALTLGISKESSVRELTNALREASRRIGEDAEVIRLRRIFERIQQATEEGSLPMPGEQFNLLEAVQ